MFVVLNLIADQICEEETQSGKINNEFISIKPTDKLPYVRYCTYEYSSQTFLKAAARHARQLIGLRTLFGSALVLCFSWRFTHACSSKQVVLNSSCVQQQRAVLN